MARAAELHDIGKIAVPDAILHKRTPLNPAEWEIMRNHPVDRRAHPLVGVGDVPVAKLVRSTHERWDGGGYPDGLAGDGIPLGSRLIAICEAFVSMTESRPWRPTLTLEAAAAELQRCAGAQFDPALVASFCAFVYPDLLLEGGHETLHGESHSNGLSPHVSVEPDVAP